jgi:intein/homing endonuclease
VLTTTTRESDAIVEIYLHGETIRATRGHPMWVNGRQWQMAKQLRRGDLLHGANGPASVIALRGSSRTTTVYNLVVANTHTYFVGHSRVLVHDNSLYTPPAGVIPGK